MSHERDGRDDRVTTSAIGAGRASSRIFFAREIPSAKITGGRNQVKDQARNPDATRVVSIIYLLLRRSPLMVETSHPRGYTQVHRHTRRALARRHTRAMRYLLRIRFDGGDASVR